MAEYREIVEKLPDGITLHDADDGSILETNQQFCEMVGYTREELLALDFGALHVDEPPYTSDRAEQYIRKAATEGPQTFEWRDETKDGEVLPVEVHLRRTTIDGEPRILAVVRDITDRKERERALERKNERLEEFASVVSHDLRNPVNVMEGNLERVREECTSPHLDAMERALDRMDTLIEDLLSIAHGGGTHLEVTDVALADLVEQCWQTVETADATLRIDTERTIRADRHRLQQLLENLFRNAIEHGGKDVTIAVRDLDGVPGFYVEDTGPGVPADQRSQIFDLGYSTSQDGTGFGLRIVEEIVEDHDWEISVTEGAAGGARFELRGVAVAD